MGVIWESKSALPLWVLNLSVSISMLVPVPSVGSFTVSVDEVSSLSSGSAGRDFSRRSTFGTDAEIDADVDGTEGHKGSVVSFDQV